MASLSNIFRRFGGRNLEIRQAVFGEHEAAVRLILSAPRGSLMDAQVGEFLRLAREQSGAAGGIWVAAADGEVVGAVLPVTSPGQTMLLFFSSNLEGEEQIRTLSELLETCCGHARGKGITLAQVLLDPRDGAQRQFLGGLGFGELAELIYLQKTLDGAAERPMVGEGFGWVTYSEGAHDLFARTIMRGYEQSLDCPALNGVRDVNDTICGHKAAGIFRPETWFVLTKEGVGVGVILLSEILTGEGMELVYLGLAPEARGKGLGDFLMRHGLWVSKERGFRRLSLAVDSINWPALNLYGRHGMKEFYRRMAMMRDLRG